MDYHADRFTDHSLVAVDDKGKWLAALPANISGSTLYSHQGLTYGGWILPVRGVNGAVMLEIFDALTDYLRDCGVSELVYKAIPSFYHRYPSDEDIYALFRQGASLGEVNLSSTICLSNPVKFNENSRRNLKKAQARGIEVRQSEDFSSYWRILSEVLAQKHDSAPVHTVQEMQMLHTLFPENIRLFCAFSPEGEMLGGTVIYDTGTVAHTQYIASSEDGRKCGALPAIFHHLIHQVYSERRYFDFGTSNESHGLVLNSGLISQKSGFGASGTAHMIFKKVLS